jgi:hypothetical protein
MRRALRLAAALFRFTGEEVVRSRRGFYFVLLGALAIAELLLAARRSGDGVEGLGFLFMPGLWMVAAPLCRSWVDEDVRLGYAALWLQKPVRPFDFYLARLVAVMGWSILAAIAVSLAALPGFALAGDPFGVIELLVGVGWIATLLVVLSFLGSTLGARNGALFAYAMLFAGFGLQGFADAVWLGPAYNILEIILPPATAGLGAVMAIGNRGVMAGIAQLWPVLVYTVACALIGVLLSLNVPSRLTRSE